MVASLLVVVAASYAIVSTYQWATRDVPTHPLSQFVRFCGWLGSAWEPWESRSA